jgi:hypothetical protein
MDLYRVAAVMGSRDARRQSLALEIVRSISAFPTGGSAGYIAPAARRLLVVRATVSRKAPRSVRAAQARGIRYLLAGKLK